jgi:hypothetical protein
MPHPAADFKFVQKFKPSWKSFRSPSRDPAANPHTAERFEKNAGTS